MIRSSPTAALNFAAYEPTRACGSQVALPLARAGSARQSIETHRVAAQAPLRPRLTLSSLHSPSARLDNASRNAGRRHVYTVRASADATVDTEESLTVSTVLAKVRGGLKGLEFNDVIAVINDAYSYTPRAFSVGKGYPEEISSEAGTNEGSAKVFSFAKLNGLSKDATLALFCEHYESVLADPDGTAHANIRAFMAAGWEGVEMPDLALSYKVKVTYFPIEAAAEKVRLTLAMTDTVFDDDRIDFASWAELKPKMKYGQLPRLEIDGKEWFQSPAMMRYIAQTRDKSGTLYPTSDPVRLMEVEDALGLSDDMARSWSPCIYIAMKPDGYGYDPSMPAEEKAALAETLRSRWLKDELPRFMGYLSDRLTSGGPFLCGEHVTIADLCWLPQLRYYTKGIADFVPADSLAPYPVVTDYIDRVMALPQIKAWYDRP